MLDKSDIVDSKTVIRSSMVIVVVVPLVKEVVLVVVVVLDVLVAVPSVASLATLASPSLMLSVYPYTSTLGGVSTGTLYIENRVVVPLCRQISVVEEESTD
jgi:hypothetical protein